MRTLNAPAIDLLGRIASGEKVPIVQLVELRLTTTVYLTTAGRAIQWGGHTWQPMGLGTIEPVKDDVAELQSLSFTLPGVDQARLSLALTEPVEGKVIKVFDALIEPATGQVVDAVAAWSGTLNVPQIDDGQTATVSVTAEHRGMVALRPKPSRYTDDEQRRRYPGDTSLHFDPATDAGPLVWPKASFFRQ